MRTIVVFGAGMSASVLIDYLLENGEKEDWKVRVGDHKLENATAKVRGRVRGEAFAFDVKNEFQRLNEISEEQKMNDKVTQMRRGSKEQDAVSRDAINCHSQR